MKKFNISNMVLPENFHEITDFYIPESDPSMGILYPDAVEINEMPEYHEIAKFLASKASEVKKLEFSLELVHEDERIILRGHSISSVEGKIFIFRRLPSYVPSIEEIGLPKAITELLLSERLNSGGLVIIAGETGQGKSTTAAATIAHRLSHYGSFCLTIEDPVELPLQGFYPNERDSDKQGVCFQTEVEDSNNLFEMIKSALRCYPSKSNSILFLGETRDAIMASEVLKIAANGHLVITTMHGGNLDTSLKRFVSLASSVPNVNENDVKSMFASVFRLMIHQRMEVSGNGRRKIRAEVLFCPSSTSPIANRIKNGKIEMLATDIQTQKNYLSSGQSILRNVE